MRARDYRNLRRIAAMHRSKTSVQIAMTIGINDANVRKSIRTIARYPELIAELEAEIAELKAIHEIFLAAKEGRKSHTKYGPQPKGGFYKGLRIVKNPERNHEAVAGLPGQGDCGPAGGAPGRS